MVTEQDSSMTIYYLSLCLDLRLTAANKPPAEEAHEASYNNDHSDGDPRDGPRGEPAPVGARGRTGGPTAVRAVSIVAHTDRVGVSGVAGTLIHA
eukprot:XP_001705561.1 Hypothetical protein GL50803_25506 [Giardia lamblia ATCC 50803]